MTIHTLIRFCSPVPFLQKICFETVSIVAIFLQPGANPRPHVGPTQRPKAELPGTRLQCGGSFAEEYSCLRV